MSNQNPGGGLRMFAQRPRKQRAEYLTSIALLMRVAGGTKGRPLGPAAGSRSRLTASPRTKDSKNFALVNEELGGPLKEGRSQAEA